MKATKPLDNKLMAIKLHVKFHSLYHFFNFARIMKHSKDMGENESDGHWL
jgi:hypothetical protein